MTIQLPLDFHKPLWDKFNTQQRKAVKQIDGAVQICAVAGSGKTTVIVHRTEHMINDLKIDPSSIALMTFTSKAAQEMGERLQKLISKKDYDNMFCGTSHSFGYRVLAKEYKDINHPLASFTRKDFKDPGLLTGTSLKYFSTSVKEKILQLPLQNDIINEIEGIAENQFLKVVSLCKNADLDPQQYEDMCVMEDPSANRWAYIHYYKMYEKMKDERRCIDFDDMLFKAVRLFRSHPAILKKYQKQYKYVVIDETQDNNPTQYALAEMIAKPENNVYVVGDDDQSLYTFRGAEPNLFIDFCEKYENAIQIPLEDNYRSKPEILKVANLLINHNTKRIKKHLVAHSKSVDKSVFYSHFLDEIKEAEFVANEIDNICNDPDADFMDSIPYNRVFIIYRTNAQNKEMEDALITKGIPYVIHGGMSFYERREVKDILAYLRLVNDTDDNDAFKRVYNVPSRYLGKAFLNKIDDNGKSSLWDRCSSVVLTKKEQDSVNSFKAIVNTMTELKNKGGKIDELIDCLMKSGYEEHLKKDNKDESEDEDNEIVEKLKFFVRRFDNIENLIKYVEVMSGKRKEDVNGVQLMTVHRSKGLEAHAVFGIGINEGLMPHIRSKEAFDSGENPFAIEEERRLAYVLVTRAETFAYLSSTSSFNGKSSERSRFIEEMELVKVDKDEEDVQEIEEEKYTPPVREVYGYATKEEYKGIGQLPDIPYVTYVEIKPEPKQEQKTESSPPDGFIYIDDPLIGRILKPIAKGK
jgi:DNA helicase-2/ATP-dependent DNA helicase PcrA